MSPLPAPAMRRASRTRPWLIAAALLPGLGGGAAAHAIVVGSEPAVGATLAAGAEVAVALRYNSRIDAGRSRLILVGPRGEVALPLRPAAGPAELDARTPALTPGAYRIRWQVLAVDGHITRGDVPFTVAAP